MKRGRCSGRWARGLERRRRSQALGGRSPLGANLPAVCRSFQFTSSVWPQMTHSTSRTHPRTTSCHGTLEAKKTSSHRCFPRRLHSYLACRNSFHRCSRYWLPASLQENRKERSRRVSSRMVSFGLSNVRKLSSSWPWTNICRDRRIGDWYPERNIFQIFIALASGLRTSTCIVVHCLTVT